MSSDREEILARAYLIGRGYDSHKIDDLKQANSPEWKASLEITSALRSAATPDPGYAQVFEACRDAAKKAAWSAIDPSIEGIARECAERAVVAIAALPAPAGVEDWQDISTAPKDRTDILCFIESSKEQFVCFWDGHHWRFGTFQNGNLVCEPTHWRPLPPPPTILAKPAQEGGS